MGLRRLQDHRERVAAPPGSRLRHLQLLQQRQRVLEPPGWNQTGFLHREVIGFEKTFLDGNASFGMRLPRYD